MPESFRCTIVTPEQSIFDEAITHASIPAWDGQIGLLHHRAPLLAKLGFGPLKLDLAGGTQQTFFVGGGFAQMKGDELTILTDEAVPADKLNAEEAEAAFKEAQALRATNEETAERKHRDLERARAMLAVAQHAGR